MRTSIYAFLLLTALILTPCASHAGVDDSDLKLFSLTGDKLLGMTNEGFNEDTQFGAVCSNLFNTGNGLINWFENDAIFTTSETAIYDFFTIPGSAFGIPAYFYGTTSGVWLRVGAGPAEYLITPAADYFPSVFLYAFRDTSDVYVINPSACYKYSLLFPDAPSKVTLTGVTHPLVSATSWNNRTWLAGGVVLYWSSAVSKADFTPATSLGGQLMLPEAGLIFKIVGTNYGLYIFAANGIFMITGGPEFASWQVTRIGGVSLGVVDCAFEYKNMIIFRVSEPDRAVYQINGTSITKLVHTLQDDTSLYYGQMRILSDRFLVFCDPNDDDDYYYDLQNKSWGKFSGIKKFDQNYQSVYYLAESGASTAVRYYPEFLPAYGALAYSKGPVIYQTAWQTLDGNNSNQKEIKRIEIDYFCFNDCTIEARLYFAYGTSTNYIGKSFTGFAAGGGGYNGANPMTGTFTWNVSAGYPTRKINLRLESSATPIKQVMIKGIRIYYKDIGNYNGRGTR